MTILHRIVVAPIAVVIALTLTGCERAPAVDPAASTGSTVRASSSEVAASTPMPVAPAGLTNSSTASQGNDLSNSTSASGQSNVYQPPSDRTESASLAASQSVSSQSRGTSQPPRQASSP